MGFIRRVSSRIHSFDSIFFLYHVWAWAVRKVYPEKRKSFSEHYNISRLPDISDEQIAKLLAGLVNQPFELGDCLSNYYCPKVGEYVTTLNRDHQYYKVTPVGFDALGDIVRSACGVAERVLEHPVAVVNCRLWSTPPSHPDSGPNAWHVDGFPERVFKSLVYLTKVGGTLGGTELKAQDGRIVGVSGEAGCFLLFNNNLLIRRGVAPEKGQASQSRVILEVTMIPSFRSKWEPIQAGTAAGFPLRPWRFG